MSDISDTEKLDALVRIRTGPDFLEMFVDKKGKLNVTKMREKFEQYEARIAELEAEEQLFNKTFDAQQVIIEELEAENQRLRGALRQIAESDVAHPLVVARRALLGGGDD